MDIKIIAHLILRSVDGKVLILQRSKNNDVLPEKWDIPGGTIETGETVFNGLVREVFEETGLNIVCPLIPLFFTENIDLKKNTHFLKLVFLCQNINYQSITLNPDEHDNYKWVTSEEINQYSLVDYLRDNISKIFNEKR